MATYSTTAIINHALVLCGASTVASLTEDSANARALNSIYEIARKGLLTETAWSFAITRSTLATNSTASLVSWFHEGENSAAGYVYTRPSDALQILEVSDPKAKWREESDLIISDTLGLKAKYIFDQSDVSKFPPYFVDAFIDKLCIDIAYQIINDLTKAAAFVEKLERVSLPKAKAKNAQGSTKSSFSITATTAVNRALVLCGVESIYNIPEKASALNAIYHIARQSMMADAPWSFAVTRSTLSTNSSISIAWRHQEEGAGSAYVYTRPSNALRILEMSDPKAVWREEGGYIISDTLGLGAKYIQDQTDESLWSPFFTVAFIDKLCADIYAQILKDKEASVAFLEKFEKITFPRAKSHNAQGSTKPTFSTTVTTTVNRALVLLGLEEIYNFNEDTPKSSALNAIYNIARRTMMTECPWSFSTTRSTLVTNTTTSLIPWFHDEEGSTAGFVYNRPSNALRLLEVSDPRATWREEGGYIISDTTGLGIKYIYDQTDESLWSPHFVTAFIDKLCADILLQIANDPKRGAVFLEKLEKISLPRAKAYDAQGGTKQVPLDDAWTSAKYLDGGGDPSRSYN